MATIDALDDDMFEHLTRPELEELISNSKQFIKNNRQKMEDGLGIKDDALACMQLVTENNYHLAVIADCNVELSRRDKEKPLAKLKQGVINFFPEIMVGSFILTILAFL